MLLVAACATPEAIKRDGYLGEFDGKKRYTFQLAKPAWGYRASQNFEAAVGRLSFQSMADGLMALVLALPASLIASPQCWTITLSLMGLPISGARNGHCGVDSGGVQNDTLRLPPPSFFPRLSPVVAFVVTMSFLRPFCGYEGGKK